MQIGCKKQAKSHFDNANIEKKGPQKEKHLFLLQKLYNFAAIIVLLVYRYPRGMLSG